MLTRREVATIVAGLVHWRFYGHPLKVRLPAELGGQVPLSDNEIDALVVRLVNGECQEDEKIL